MRILIIEDENLIARKLQRLVEKLEPQAEILAIIGSVEKASQYLQNNPTPDLILSDIQLSDGVSFDIFKQAPVECPIIFTTAYDEYAIRAFKLNSIDYLLKPVDEDDLKNAFAKFKKLSPDPKAVNEQLAQLLHDLTFGKEAKKYKERFMAYYAQTIVPVPENQVAYFVKDELVYLVTTDKRKLVTDYKSLDELQELTNPARFFRANRQYIIHIDAVEGYKNHYTGKLIAKLKDPNSFELDISREKAPIFKTWME
jgi:two-component system, LytTR family, response regulator